MLCNVHTINLETIHAPAIETSTLEPLQDIKSNMGFHHQDVKLDMEFLYQVIKSDVDFVH
jgi:hypothetical protein